jgi:hypothetical protein
MLFFIFFKQEQQHKFDNEHKDRLAQELASAHAKMRDLTATTDSLNNSNKQLTLEVSFFFLHRKDRLTKQCPHATYSGGVSEETYYRGKRDLL